MKPLTASQQGRRLEKVGFAAFQVGRLEEAEEAFRLAAIAAPESPDAWVGLGSALARQGRHEEAALVFAVGAVAAPTDPWPVLLAAEAHLVAGQTRSANEALDWIDALDARGFVDATQQDAALELRARAAGVQS